MRALPRGLLEVCPYRELCCIRGGGDRGRGWWRSLRRLRGIVHASQRGRATRARIFVSHFPSLECTPRQQQLHAHRLHLGLLTFFPVCGVWGFDRTYLIEIDDWLPEVVALLVEISHTDLSEVTWMVLIHVGSVMMLSTCQTTSTGMLAVLSHTTVTGGDVSAAVEYVSTYSASRQFLFLVLSSPAHQQSKFVRQIPTG